MSKSEQTAAPTDQRDGDTRSNTTVCPCLPCLPLPAGSVVHLRIHRARGGYPPARRTVTR